MEDGAASNIPSRVDKQYPKITTSNPDEQQEEKGYAAQHKPLAELRSPTVSGAARFTPLPFQRRRSVDLDDYFTGPRDMSKHSKWPLFLQMHGSILPKMILPLFLVACWSTAITVINEKVYRIGIESVLLTVLGFLVGMGLSFRSSTAYERYAEGRKAWAQLVMVSQNLGRVFWIHANDVPEGDPRESLLQKLSAMNLVVAFSVALKHSLRFEPYSGYDDLQYLVGHLNTFAKVATDAQPEKCKAPKKKMGKEMGEYLGVSFAASNPRKNLKKSTHPLGNLPLEILNHLAIILDRMVSNGQLPVPMMQTMAYNNLNALNEVLTHCERILNTPLPIAYGIAISQITWVYAIVLPFQLVNLLRWVAIPASVVASYVLLGLHLIGREIENPFGSDVNDLPLEMFCEQIAHDMDVTASFDKREPAAFLDSRENLPLYPMSIAPVSTWMQRTEDDLRDAIREKPNKIFRLKRGETFKTVKSRNSSGIDNMV